MKLDVDKLEIDEAERDYIAGLANDRCTTLQCIVDVIERREDLLDYGLSAIKRIFEFGEHEGVAA